MRKNELEIALKLKGGGIGVCGGGVDGYYHR